MAILSVTGVVYKMSTGIRRDLFREGEIMCGIIVPYVEKFLILLYENFPIKRIEI